MLPGAWEGARQRLKGISRVGGSGDVCERSWVRGKKQGG